MDLRSTQNRIALALALSSCLALAACSSSGDTTDGDASTSDASTSSDGSVSSDAADALAALNVCDRASLVVVRCTQADASLDPNADVSCFGETAAYAQCIVDHSQAACGFGTDSEKKAYTDCLRNAAESADSGSSD